MENISNEAVIDIARNLFDNNGIDYIIGENGMANIDTENLPDVEEYEYYYGEVDEEELNKAINLLIELISKVKFYIDDNGAYIELSDNHTLWNINAPEEYVSEFDIDYYQYLVDQALGEFEERTGVKAYQNGRMGRHIVVDITFDNMVRYNELKEVQQELEAEVIKEAEDECFPVDEITEGLNKGERQARCLNCGVDVIYTNKDVEHDIDGDYIECPNCRATFDVDYNNIEPSLNKIIEDVDSETEPTVSLKEAEEKCEEVKKQLNEKLPEYMWLVNIAGLEIIISDLNSKSDFRYTKNNGWGKSQKQVEEILTQIFKTPITLEYYNNGVGAKTKAIVKGITIVDNKVENIEEVKSNEEDKEIWYKIEKIVDLVDTEIAPDESNEYRYDEHIKFVFYRDRENTDVYEVYTYFDGEIQEDLDTGDVHISDLDGVLVDIIKKLQDSKVKTEAEDMSKVKDDVKLAVEKSDSTKQEKDQVKGSINVLKADEESAIDGYEEFNKETAKVVDKELADTLDDQMQEIVDDEKEHIEKLDTIKSALGEGLELDDEETKFINAMVTRSKSDIEDFLGYDLTSKQFKDKQSLRLAIKEIYEQMPDEEFNKFKSALGESKEAPRLTGDETYVARNSSGYKSIGLIIDNTNKQFQIINGQVMTTDSKTKKMSKKQIRDKAQQLYDKGYTEYDGYGSVAQGVNKKEELFNVNIDAGDIASGNNFDLGALTDLMASEETKESNDKLEEATTGDVIKENLNTGVLPIIDVDMYSLNEEIPERATQEGLDEIIQDIAPKYLKEVIQDVLPSVEIYATGVYHPKQYNFSGDELEFVLEANKGEYEALKNKVISDENFNAYLRNNYKSYDGFISYMADDISEFETQDTWKQLVQVIMFALRDEGDFEAIRDEYLDEFLDRVRIEFGWDDEEDDDLEENKGVNN